MVIPGFHGDYITEVTEEIDERVRKKLSQEFSRPDCRILGTLCKLDNFLVISQVRVNSKYVPETKLNFNVEDEEIDEDRFQKDPHPETGTSFNGSPQISDTKEVSYIIT